MKVTQHRKGLANLEEEIKNHLVDFTREGTVMPQAFSACAHDRLYAYGYGMVIGRDIEGPRIDLGMSLKGPIMKKDGTPLSLWMCGGEEYSL